MLTYNKYHKIQSLMYFTIRTPCICFLASSFHLSSLSPNCRIQEQRNLDCFLWDPLNLCLWVVTHCLAVLIWWHLRWCLVLSQHRSPCGQRSPPQAEPLDGASVRNLTAKSHRSASWSAAEGCHVMCEKTCCSTFWIKLQTFCPVVAQTVGDWAEKGRVLRSTPVTDKTWRVFW